MTTGTEATQDVMQLSQSIAESMVVAAKTLALSRRVKPRYALASIMATSCAIILDSMVDGEMDAVRSDVIDLIKGFGE